MFISIWAVFDVFLNWQLTVQSQTEWQKVMLHYSEQYVQCYTYGGFIELIL